MPPTTSFRLLQRVRTWAKTFPAKLAYVDAKTNSSLNYGALNQRVVSLQLYLQKRVHTGDTVLLRCGNRVEFPIWFLALIANGCAICLANPDLTVTEIEQLAGRTGAAAIIGGASLGSSTLPLIDIENAMQCETCESPAPHAPPGTLLLASSGTTGQSKIVRRSAASIDAVAAAMVDAIRFSTEDDVLASVPLTHSYGIEHGLLAPLWAGSTVHLCNGFDLVVFADALGKHTSVFPAVPAMIEMLATVAGAPSAMPRLRVAYSAGGPLLSSVNERFAQRFGRAVGQVYGMTEIGSVTFNDPNEKPFFPASVGRAMNNVSIRITEDDEIAVRADSMFEGYLGESADLIDGYFHTGDLGRIDADGNMFITGRLRLLIDTGGMKVNPIEIETVINTHPQVRESVVVAMRQTDTMNRLRAIIIPLDIDRPPPLDSVRALLKSAVAGYKLPRVIEFRASLPRSATGKVLRQQLEAEPCDT